MTAATLRNVTASLPAAVEVILEIQIGETVYRRHVATVRTDCESVQGEKITQWPVSLVLAGEVVE